jgi:hypothetical protein
MKILTIRLALALLALTAFLMISAVHPPSAAAAACTQPSASYGTVTSTVSVPTNGTYRVWTRMAAADASSATYLLEIDDNNCFTVGGSSVPTYASGATTHFSNNSSNWISKTASNAQVDISLTAGNHKIELIGNAAGVVIDRLVLTADTACVPTGNGENCANPPDTTNPIVSITSPAPNETVNNGFVVKVNAADPDSTITKVELFIDSATTPYVTDTSSPYEMTVNNLSPGTHKITVKTTNSYSLTASASRDIIVADSTGPTGVAITSPANNSTQQGVITVAAQASDNVEVTKLEFLVDGQIKATDMSAPFSASLDTTTLSNASHQLTVKAYDEANNMTASGAISITVNNAGSGGDTTPPTVALPLPAGPGGSTPIIAGKSYQIAPSVTDANGIKQVVFSINGAAKATVTTAPFSFNLDTTSLTPGTYTLQAQATDKATPANTATTSVQIRITALADVTRDCRVNILDISSIIPKMGTTSSTGDVNNDGKISILDISAIVPKFNTTTCTP